MNDVESATDRRVWRHCSPELLRSGVDCAATPRRPCAGVTCGPGSHDHLVDPDQRPRSLVDSSTDQIEWARDLVTHVVPGVPNAGRHAWRRERPSPVSRSQALALIYTALREAQPGIEPWEFHGIEYVLDRLGSFSRSDARRIGLSDEPWANAGVTRGLR
jgi:hypothetical protein